VIVAQNFLPCDREQQLLLPPSLREWLPEDHLAWFVVRRLELPVADDVHFALEAEAERLVEPPAPFGVGDAHHRV